VQACYLPSYSNNKLDYRQACRPTRRAGVLALARGVW
jgi:hypothetical protein